MQNAIECIKCGTLVPKPAPDVVSVTCHECVTDSLRQFEVPRKQVKAASLGYPKGWKFMKIFVHATGVVYYRGVEQPLLKDTLPITVIAVKVKKSKAQKAAEKQELLTVYASLKSQLKKETRKTIIKKLTSKIKKIEKKI